MMDEEIFINFDFKFANNKIDLNDICRVFSILTDIESESANLS